MSILEIPNFKMTHNYLDLNCDVGEGVGNEKQLLPLLSSCNIACGGHTGNKESMTEVVSLAKENNVLVGAHPSYPDISNFGRISIKMGPKELINSIGNQVEGLVEVLDEQGVKLHHIKPHGALYNDIAKDESLAVCFLEAIKKYKKDTCLYVPYNSEIAKVALKEGFQIKYEGFADRNYEVDLSLVSRKQPNALITDKKQVLKHIVEIVNHKRVTTIGGKEVPILVDTFCIHGDTPSALEIVLYLTQELPNHNMYIKK
ncbi:5-oxoprolinase subunit PxpA [Zobellia nedashkovskayae]|uniref:5-oxoprolinase subunit PxpA n=1 Tax=Zobellia nedashkovskayae TaxID=2779510 RepID=UPI001D042ECB|nr:5-oxoprolinase subunit PxpA [Zobellia nedashkovskayae]